MRHSILITFVAVLLSAIGAAAAADRACLLEGRLKIGSQVTEIKDCMQNRGIGTGRFLESCRGIAEIGAGMGAPPKVTYLDACPAGAQAACEGLFGQPVDAHYYKRSATDLADARSSCLAQNGRWRTGEPAVAAK